MIMNHDLPRLWFDELFHQSETQGWGPLWCVFRFPETQSVLHPNVLLVSSFPGGSIGPHLHLPQYSSTAGAGGR